MSGIKKFECRCEIPSGSEAIMHRCTCEAEIPPMLCANGLADLCKWQEVELNTARDQFSFGEHVEICDENAITNGKYGVVSRKYPDENGKIMIDFDGGWCGWYFPNQLRKIHVASETQLPEWCQIGRWVYCDGNGFGKIVDIVPLGDCKKPKVEFGNGCGIQNICVLKPARIRPWDFKSAPAFVKTLENGEYRMCCWVLNGVVSGEASFLCHKDNSISAGKMAETLTQIDGSPCGILEVVENER